MIGPSDDGTPYPDMLVGSDVKLVAPLGAGTMGAVWRADHLELNKPVAVKFIAANLRNDATLRQRFEREAQAAAQIDTLHVVQILGQGVTEHGAPYMVMELLEGENLAELLEREQVLPPRSVAAMMTQVAKALRGAHRQGIVHRDIKPENIFLVDSGEDIFVKVLDFGVAKVTESVGMGLTQVETVLGTPYYMSAEQIRSSKNVTPHADLWSLSVVCYEALTGELPFTGNSVAAIFLAIQDGSFAKPSELRPELTPEIDRWFEKAFNRVRSARFQSAGELAASFLEVTQSLPAAFDPGEDVKQWLQMRQFRISSIPPSSHRSSAEDCVPPLPQIALPGSERRRRRDLLAGVVPPAAPSETGVDSQARPAVLLGQLGAPSPSAQPLVPPAPRLPTIPSAAAPLPAQPAGPAPPDRQQFRPPAAAQPDAEPVDPLAVTAHSDTGPYEIPPELRRLGDAEIEPMPATVPLRRHSWVPLIVALTLIVVAVAVAVVIILL